MVSNNSTLCAAKILTEYSEFALSNSDTCSSFALNLQYVPASSPCQQGGLYLIEGSVTAPGGGPILNYTYLTLAAWDAQGNFIEPWITPFDTPAPISQASQPNWKLGDPLNTLGSWTYNVDYGYYNIPPTACSLKTTVELTLSCPAENIAPRVYHYDVTEMNTGGQITASISANEPTAPTALIELDESSSSSITRRLSFVGLDALRDAKAEVRIAFIQPTQVVPVPAGFVDPLSPHVDIDQEIDIASGYPPAPLASHLARFFSGFTAPLKAVSGNAEVNISVELSTPLEGGMSTVIPLVLFKDQPYTPGIDDNNICTMLPNPGLICNLAAAITTAAGSPDPSASYILDIALARDAAEAPADRIVLAIPKAVLPVSKISE